MKKTSSIHGFFLIEIIISLSVLSLIIITYSLIQKDQYTTLNQQSKRKKEFNFCVNLIEKHTTDNSNPPSLLKIRKISPQISKLTCSYDKKELTLYVFDKK